MHGEGVEYHDNGQIHFKGTFINGIFSKGKEHDNDGTIIEKENLSWRNELGEFTVYKVILLLIYL